MQVLIKRGVRRTKLNKTELRQLTEAAAVLNDYGQIALNDDASALATGIIKLLATLEGDTNGLPRTDDTTVSD